jgi:hypothetical protein
MLELCFIKQRFSLVYLSTPPRRYAGKRWCRTMPSCTELWLVDTRIFFPRPAQPGYRIRIRIGHEILEFWRGEICPIPYFPMSNPYPSSHATELPQRREGMLLLSLTENVWGQADTHTSVKRRRGRFIELVRAVGSYSPVAS